MIYFSKRWTAEEALAAGIVDEVVAIEDLHATTMQLATELAPKVLFYFWTQETPTLAATAFLSLSLPLVFPPSDVYSSCTCCAASRCLLLLLFVAVVLLGIACYCVRSPRPLQVRLFLWFVGDV